jgi:hypothetical protein
MADNKINPDSYFDSKSVQSIVTRIQNVKTEIAFIISKVKIILCIFCRLLANINQLPVTMVGDSVMISFDVDMEEW